MMRKPMEKIMGLDDDAPTVENEKGGKQSATSYRFDLLDMPSMFALGNILREGAEKYTPNNWRKIPVEDHINHAIGHLCAHLMGHDLDDHLGHAFCRAMFALGVHLADQEAKK